MAGDLLIGSTGFVGTNLLRSRGFAAQCNSATIAQMRGGRFDTVVCAAAPGSMVAANRAPEADRAAIENLIGHLETLSARRFVLISTIAVLAQFDAGDDETSTGFQEDLAYGCHRRHLEAFCQARFPGALILRLPALYGAGLKKNFLFDLANPVPSMLTAQAFDALSATMPAPPFAALASCLSWQDGIGMHVLDRAMLNARPERAAIETALVALGRTALQFTHRDSRFQYFGLAGLSEVIARALEAGVETLHVATEPVSAAEVHLRLLGREMPETGAKLHREDFHTRHAGVFGGAAPYLRGREAVIADIARWYRDGGWI
ncbi:hypothetical protein [Pseudothioclava arenosa]|uniref:NAD-dependent epimerase/dehydratase domain-containing protein n=1 Tax=Pseudothioclava arenosa TaxID=1795308 RepID=A0A2A4CNT0_9RHOB|nr:hypothetical protein [Pseudothioclava arenosa]PCD75786.1 hypothetical protein CLN94_11540 [Pseudothioclava arenosa]